MIFTERKWTGSILVFIVVFLCLFMEWWWSRPGGLERRVCAVVSSAVSLREGERVLPQRVSIRFHPLPGASRCEEVFFTEAQLDQSRTWVVLRPVEAEQTLYAADVRLATKGPALPRGLRAFAARFSGAIAVLPGDYVDVFSSASSRNVASAALVLENHARSEASFELVLALRQSEIRDMEKAMQKGTLSLALVHPEDVEKALRPARRLKSKRNGPAKKPVRARIWHEE